ncbi:MAG: glycosyltransferase family 2 protein [Nitrospirales bacterium]|nr:glycosyltransferase family 2 protein [Nitrospirales bacterium]
MIISEPVITVGMPVYNGERYIEEAIRSILGQTFEDFVLIISDNASTDRTEEICRDFTLEDKRIMYLRNQENMGASNNYNRLFRLARSKYFRWFNADDLCSPELHEKCVAVLEGNPDAVLCYGKTCLIDQDGNYSENYDDNLNLQQSTAYERLSRFFDVVGQTNVIYGLMRTSAVAHTSLMGNGSYPAADTNFMAELTLYGKFIEIPEQLFYRRMHFEASSSERGDESKQQLFWTGNSRSKFTMPTWKKNIAIVKAVHSAPLDKWDKWRVQYYNLRRLVGSRHDLIKDLAGILQNTFQRKDRSETLPN